MKSNLDFARSLMLKAEEDLRAAELGWHHNLAHETVCFHLQQAGEKLLKAALASGNIDYPYTHDLELLLKLAVQDFPVLVPFRGRLAGFSTYALAMRYDAAIRASREETLAARQTVAELRSAIYSILPPEALPGTCESQTHTE